jgi:PPOX class probable F420-dependent enzyme
MTGGTLSPAVEAFLNEKRFASLATLNRDGSPQQTVMWYLLQDGKIMMNTARGRRKDLNMVRDPRVSICVEDGYRFVTISGNVELIEDDQPRAQADIHALAVRYHGQERADAMMHESFGKQQRITMLLAINHVIANGFED